MRLRKSWEFLSVKKNGLRQKNRFFWLQSTTNAESDDLPKLGIIASRRFGCAVKRNKAKRIIREIFRINRSHFPKGSRIVLIPRTAILSVPYREVESQLISAISKNTFNS